MSISGDYRNSAGATTQPTQLQGSKKPSNVDVATREIFQKGTESYDDADQLKNAYIAQLEATNTELSLKISSIAEENGVLKAKFNALEKQTAELVQNFKTERADKEAELHSWEDRFKKLNEEYTKLEAIVEEALKKPFVANQTPVKEMSLNGRLANLSLCDGFALFCILLSLPVVGIYRLFYPTQPTQKPSQQQNNENV